MKFVALMPLRGGSKEIPRKNLVSIAGKPLFYWSLKATVESDVFDQVFISTEDQEIKGKVIELFGSSVQVIDRPDDLAKDESSTESVIEHFMSLHEFDVLTLVQATSPLTKSSDLISARDKFLESKFDSLFSACELKKFIWNAEGEALNYTPEKRPRRQEFSGSLVETGAFYFTKHKIYQDKRNRLGGKIGYFLTDEKNFFDIDGWDEFKTVEAFLRH